MYKHTHFKFWGIENKTVYTLIVTGNTVIILIITLGLIYVYYTKYCSLIKAMGNYVHLLSISVIM